MKKSTLVLLCFLLAKMVMQYLFVHPIYELQRDEYLHLDQAHHLAWGFHSVPPVTSWLSWIILQLGNGYFWIKFFPALFGALTMLVIWKTIESLKGSLFACVLASTAFLLSPYMRLNLLFQPNSLDVLCYTLIYYTAIRYVQTKSYNWLYFLAISFAIGFLNKYNIVFAIAGLVPALLFTEHRKLFLKPQFYLAMVLALLLISPNLYWQFQHDFPVVKHMKELSETQLVHVKKADFLKDQLMFGIGYIIIVISALIAFLSYEPFKKFRFLPLAYLFTIIIFLVLKAKSYYALGLYPILIAFGAIYLSEILKSRRRYGLRYALILWTLLFFIPVVLVALPIKTPDRYAEDAKQKRPFSEHTWEDGKTYPISQDFADMLGWKELAQKVDSVYESLPNKQHVFILCDNYGQAGAINYYSKSKLTANAFNADYTMWMDLSKPIYTVIRILEAENNLDRERQLFAKVTVLNQITSPYAREKETQIVLLENPRADVNTILAQEREKSIQN